MLHPLASPPRAVLESHLACFLPLLPAAVLRNRGCVRPRPLNTAPLRQDTAIKTKKISGYTAFRVQKDNSHKLIRKTDLDVWKY